MPNTKQIKARTQMKSITILALFTNISLFILKVAVGIFAGSIALIADSIHSLSDTATDIGILLGVYFGSKEPDPSHQYGHGRAETFAAMFVSLLLLATGAAMIYYAAIGITKQKVIEPHFVVLGAACVSIVTKEALYRITKSAAVKHHSAALYANAWHQRSDALSSLAVLIGFLMLEFGYRYGDHLAAIAVGIMIIFVSARIFGQCFGELAERAVDEQTEKHIESIINSNQQIRQWHKLRTRTVAREIFLDLHILVDPNLNVTDAHQIAENLETALHQQLTRPVNITVHIEPDIPQLRK